MYNDISLKEALKKSNINTKLSMIIFGFGNIRNGQIIKGLIYLILEVLYIIYMVSFGFTSIINLKTLGTKTQQEVFNEAKQIYEYVSGDNSMLFLLYGIITIFITLGFICILIKSIKSAYNVQLRKEMGKGIPKFLDDLKSLKEERLHIMLLSLPVLGVILFTIIPIVFMICIAFTNYDHKHQPPGNLFTWVGLENFKSMFTLGGELSKTFFPVLAWTITWAIVATFSCYILGMLLAILINRKQTKFKSFWRFIFSLSVAVPSFVTLLTMKTVFNTNGPMNVLLRHLGIIAQTEAIPFFTDPTLAKITIILVNIWIGVPFTMLTTTGILQNIPQELFEAAKVDGAKPSTIFRKITLPYMLFVTTPYLITAFAGNINNFNVIFLLSGGGPDSLEYYYAGKTDLLVTWLYKLTITQKDYNLGSVIGILVFVILATLSLVTYRRTNAYKNESSFQ
ncbi:carbohydrate ABC transporter permease [[Clostridium] colinum]|uniref:carbohydrate ABC transporter permease n=1 Tax=[Clostridium] colinum TaxID=36835 RepID=UPI0020257996|nr:sugar ABC transporter permease [[Clostridium] colinum]